ncbi:MAG: septum formation initiator family protein [bacterium]
MVFLEDTRRKKKKVKRKRLLFVGIVFLVIIFIFGVKSIITILHQKRQIATLTQGIEKIKQENEALRKERKALKTDPSRIENLARQIGMMRHGEKKVKFVPQKQEEEK